METRPYLLQALSPLHVGTGQSAGVIDLPISRMGATGIPFVPGSSLKGVLRDARRPERDTDAAARAEHEALFGPSRKKEGPEGDTGSLDHAGALVVGDARLLALPVRSLLGTFALVTSPLLLNLARRDLAGQKALPDPVERIANREARVLDGCINVQREKDRLYLEDLDLPTQEAAWVQGWAELFASALPEQERSLLLERFVVVDDETMDFLWQTATQVDTRVQIDPKKGTVAGGSLWTEESLPAETLLLGMFAATRSMRREPALTAQQVLDRALSDPAVVQLGGKATVGRGRCRLLPWPGAAGSTPGGKP